MNGAEVNLNNYPWQTVLATAHNLGHHNCISYIQNSHNIRSMLPMLERMRQKKRVKNDLPIDQLPLDLIKEVKTMLTGHKATAPMPHGYALK